MKAKLNGKQIGATLYLAAVAAVLLTVFSLFSTPGSEQDIYLMDRDSERFGWCYDALVNGELRRIEPTFTNEYTLALPEGTEAVRITRTMTETFPSTELEWTSYSFGVEVFWNGRLLHSDFQGTERDAYGFLQSAWEELEAIQERIDRGETTRTVRMTLPGDGQDGARELSMITYFPKGWKDPQPEYPFVGSDDSEVSLNVSASVVPVTMALFNAVLALLLAAVFLVEARSGRPDGGTLLLSLYFVTMYIDVAYNSSLGSYSALKECGNLDILNRMCAAPLYLFLTLRLTKKWKYPLCAGVIGWVLYESARMFINVRQGMLAVAGRNGLGAFVLALLVGTAVILEEIFVQKRIRSRKTLLTWLLIVAVSAIVSVLNGCKGWNGMGEYLVGGVLGSLRSDYFWPAVHLIVDFASVMASMGVLLGFVREVLRRREAMSRLEERSRLTFESYNRLIAAQEATNAVYHEMRHHMTALSAILDGGDSERLRRYIASMMEQFEALPVGRYSNNLLVNVIAGYYLDRAQAEGIRVEHSLTTPEELGVADEDLSVFLNNMLQNALEACERMVSAEGRYIQVEMRVFNDFLFIKCVNSAPPPEESGARREKPRPGHGYGLAAMRRIAEKYDNILTLEQMPGRFAVKTSLCMKNKVNQP